MKKNLIKLPVLCLLFLTNNNMNTSPIKTEADAQQLLAELHSRLLFSHGSLRDEYSEQIMAALFIEANDKVLELGGNVGRNSCVIASILKDSQNLVTVETDPKTIPLLTNNRDQNKLLFGIEDSAISKTPLIQSGWDSVPGEKISSGYFKVKTIPYNEFYKKYNIPFNVLVADCEGALYYILKDDETILNGIEKIIIENDYLERSHFDYVCSKFREHGFKLVYNKPNIDVPRPCKNEFYQVWISDNLDQQNNK